MVATSVDETGRKPWDYFSWGHIDMGIGSFLILSLINTIPSYSANSLVYIIWYWLLLVIVIGIGIGWEIIENTLFYKMGIKFENRRDSLANAFWDVLFVIIGGIYIWSLKGLIVNLNGVQLTLAFYIVGIISFVIFLFGFIIGRAITKKK